MKIKVAIFLLIIITGCNSNKNNINDKSKRNSNWEWWVDGETGKAEWIPFGGNSSKLKTGRFTNFYFNGEKCEEGKLVNGKNVDTLFAYNLKGVLDFYKTFDTDSTTYIIHDGYRKVYYRDGKILAESNIKNHQFYGVLINYYENGNKRFVRNYIKDSGWSVNYYENGNIKDSSREFNNTGKGKIFKSWFENGQIQSIVNWNMKTGLQEGNTKRYSENNDNTQSILQSSADWKDGLWNGNTVLYYPNGQLKDSIFLIEGKHEGIGKSWYESGKLKMINVYRKDRIISSRSFDEKGNK